MVRGSSLARLARSLAEGGIVGRKELSAGISSGRRCSRPGVFGQPQSTGSECRS